MKRKTPREVVRGARSVAAEGQPSFVDENGRRGKHFSGGRKVASLDYVGAPTPDDDDTSLPRKPRRRAR